MDLFGGFETKDLEEKYNLLIYNTIYLFQDRIAKLYKGEAVNE